MYVQDFLGKEEDIVYVKNCSLFDTIFQCKTIINYFQTWFLLKGVGTTLQRWD